MEDQAFEQIKKLMHVIGGKAIIVEDGKPSFVIIDVDEYTDFEATKETALSDKEDGIQKTNRDIHAWKDRQLEREARQLQSDFAEKSGKKSSFEIIEDDITPSV